MAKVAVLVATYNGEAFLDELLTSLEEQEFSDFKCYIHDDGSVDKTLDIVDRHIRSGRMEIQKLDYPATGSSKANFMSMLRHVDEPYVMFCDQDDIWLKEKIGTSFRTITAEEDPEKPTLAFSDLSVVNDSLEIMAGSFMEYTGRDPYRTDLKNLLLENVAPGCTMIINKALREKAVMLEDDNKIIMHDYWMMLIAAAAGKIIYIDKPLILYRQHDTNAVGADRKINTVQRVFKVLKKFTSGSYAEFFEKWLRELQLQANEVSLLPGIPYQNAQLCRSFYMITGKKKGERIKFYTSNKVLRRKFNLWLFLWC